MHGQDIALKRYDIAPNTHGLDIGRLRKGGVLATLLFAGAALNGESDVNS
jgi:hypothetical protein